MLLTPQQLSIKASNDAFLLVAHSSQLIKLILLSGFEFGNANTLFSFFVNLFLQPITLLMMKSRQYFTSSSRFSVI